MLTTVILAPGACWGGSNLIVLAQNRYKTGQRWPEPEITGRVPGILGPYMAPLEPYKAQIWPIHGQRKNEKGQQMAIYTDYIYSHIYMAIYIEIYVHI